MSLLACRSIEDVYLVDAAGKIAYHGGRGLFGFLPEVLRVLHGVRDLGAIFDEWPMTGLG